VNVKQIVTDFLGEDWAEHPCDITIKEIVENYLEGSDYDGLYCEACSCKLNDIMPCNGINPYCRPGHLLKCKGEKCPYGIYNVNIGDCFCIGSKEEEANE